MRFVTAILFGVLCGTTAGRVASTFIVTDREAPLFVVTENGQPATVKPYAAVRPTVQGHVASWCNPCQSAKANWLAYSKDHPAPFDIEWVDWSHGGWPAWADKLPPGEEYALPAYSWVVNKQVRYVIGYPGAEKLIQRWQATQPKSEAPRPP